MGFFDLIRNFFAPRRNIACLQPSGSGDVDGVQEIVDTKGGPLKEKHLRRALRDGCLLPKTRLASHSVLTGKRKSCMTRHKAFRLFSSTFLTHNRNIRDLLPDDEQLTRYGLPRWKNEGDLAGALRISVGMLRHYSIHREMERAPHYVTFSIPKRKGGRRLIMAPKSRLKALQRALLHLLVEKLPVSDCAHGFRHSRSILTGALPHVGRKVVLHMDIKNFFPSVSFGRLRGYLVALGYGYQVATVLAVLMTEAERQPVEVGENLYHVPVTPRYCIQGAPTSPGICNSIVFRMDRRLNGAAKALGFTYTRYADDLTFSGDEPEKVWKMRARASRIIREEGFQVHRDKTRIMRSGGRQQVTGVVVNKTAGLSRQERRRLRAEAHHLAQGGAAADRKALLRFRGRVAYLSMLNREQAQAIKNRYPALFQQGS